LFQTFLRRDYIEPKTYQKQTLTSLQRQWREREKSFIASTPCGDFSGLVVDLADVIPTTVQVGHSLAGLRAISLTISERNLQLL
jgi:hypothetical protein